MGSATAQNDYLYSNDTNNTGAVLTFGPNLVINDNAWAYTRMASATYNHSGDGIDNQGTINFIGNAQGYEASIFPYNFTNEGNINISNGRQVYLDPNYSLTNTATGKITLSDAGSALYFGYSGYSATATNAGTITLSHSGETLYFGSNNSASSNSGTINADGDTVYLYSYGAFSNTGTMNIKNSAVHLAGTFTTAQLQAFANNGNTIYIDGTLDNSGATLDVGTGTNLTSVALTNNSVISGGTIVDHGSGISFQGGKLNGVIYDGTLDMSANSSNLYVYGGLTTHAMNGTGNGTINMTGTSSQLFFVGTQTFDNAVINMGDDTHYSEYLWDYDANNTDTMITFGPNLVINDNAFAWSYFYSANYGRANDGFDNKGTINIQGNTQGNGYYARIQPYDFINEGTINVLNNDGLRISAPTFTNTGSLNATAGSLYVEVNELGGGTASISGTSLIEYDGASNDNVTFTSGATGTLRLMNSAAYTGTITGFTGAGTGAPATSDKLDLHDINFSSASFDKSYQNNVLHVTDGTHTADIKFAGSYTLSNFTFATDGNGGTLVTDPPTGEGDGALDLNHDGSIAGSTVGFSDDAAATGDGVMVALLKQYMASGSAADSSSSSTTIVSSQDDQHSMLAAAHG
jgi:hypothetical protein